MGVILIGGFFMRGWLDTMMALSAARGALAASDPAYLQAQTWMLIVLAVQIAALVFLVCLSIFKPFGKRGKG